MLSVSLLLAFACSPLVSASVQTPTLTQCPSSTEVQVSDVVVRNARIEKLMVVDFKLTVRGSLEWNPTLQIVMRTKGGYVMPCYNNIGSCTYKLCAGTSGMEQNLGKPWNNQCPVPAMTAQESICMQLDPALEPIIGVCVHNYTISWCANDDWSPA